MSQLLNRLLLNFRRALIATALGVLSLSGCDHNVDVSSSVGCTECVIPEGAILVPGNAGWVDAGIDVEAGEFLQLSAGGTVVVEKANRKKQRQQVEVGPAGTYLYSDRAGQAAFPLPAGNQGPAPCYALIGRIGEGRPFFIGAERSLRASESGRLFVRVNDFQPGDNSGRFYVSATKTESPRPIGSEEVVPAGGGGEGMPVSGASAIVFYVDGLRPDVAREMAAMGHLPHIKQLFVDGGAWLSNNVTAFPSDTITSNGTMWTGCFSDRHGIKGQVRFSRAELVSESYLDPLGPNRSARLLEPQGIDQFVQRSKATAIRWTKGENEGRRWEQRQTTGIPPIYGHLRSAGGDWATGVLPMMTDAPPLLWTRSLARHLPYFHAQDAWNYIDDANAHFAVRHLLPRHAPVTIIWLPETDSVSHKRCRGQFGATRRTIARADELIGKVVAEVEAQGRMESTYFVLVSDHGHHGGRKSHLSHFDIADDFFYRPRRLSREGAWVGGGLGLSVRQHRYANFHSGDSQREFVFIDGDTDGAARIFLPRGHYSSGNWSGPNHPGDLMAYRIAGHLPPVNLIETLTSAAAVAGDGTVRHPIDLVLVKLDENSILITTQDRGSAVVRRKRDAKGGWVYRYSVVSDLQPTSNGNIRFRTVEFPQRDPLELLSHMSAENFRYYYPERRWLEATVRSKYPDAVVTLTRHMLWQPNLAARESEFAPDFVVTARPGWYFGTKSTPGTNHGYPLADSMRASWFVSGPNVRRGARIETATRLADLTPTLLDMVGFETGEAGFDGEALRMIYEPNVRQVSATRRPLYWEDVDLDAWQPIEYAPVAESKYKPFTVNRPASPFDLSNVVYNAATLTELNIFRLFDDVLSPLAGDREFVSSSVDTASEHMRRSDHAWVREAGRAVNLSEVTLGDYSYTSLGNLRRVDGVIDWTQHRAQNLDAKIAKTVGRDYLPGTPYVHKAIDGTQAGIWETYRFLQRVVIEVLDEKLISGLENQTDKAVNRFRRRPADEIVE